MGGHDTTGGQATDDLRQVGLRDVEYLRDLGSRDPPAGMHGQVDQGAQAIIGVFGQLHCSLESA